MQKIPSEMEVAPRCRLLIAVDMVYTVNMVYTVEMVYTVDMVDTVFTVFKLLKH